MEYEIPSLFQGATVMPVDSSAPAIENPGDKVWELIGKWRLNGFTICRDCRCHPPGIYTVRLSLFCLVKPIFEFEKVYTVCDDCRCKVTGYKRGDVPPPEMFTRISLSPFSIVKPIFESEEDKPGRIVKFYAGSFSFSFFAGECQRCHKIYWMLIEGSERVKEEKLPRDRWEIIADPISTPSSNLPPTSDNLP